MENLNFVVPETLAVSDSGFLFLASTGETFTLNPIAKAVFTKLKDGVTIPAIKKELLDGYDVDKQTIERDVDDFVNQLKHHKLVLPK